ncbi:lysylphosphatidylglycerol synthase domain-containing protein [Kribbella koreensis]|uniref:Lysylphosphatidylglycerol synthase domain-containing protein n=2 Tax=Kribbella TaxID=182639 RepID=A0ABP6YKU1_9ACTN
MSTPRRTITSVLTGALTIALVVLLPRAVGTNWSTVGTLLGHLSLPAIALLAVVWIAGLWSHSFVLAASLPGLTKRRGLTLSLTGSAVANVLPLGGAAGTGLNFAMTRRWGFTSAAFAGFLAVTTLINVLAKLGVIAVALALAPIVNAATALPIGHTSILPVGRAGVLLVPVLVALAGVFWFLASERAAASAGRVLDRAFSRVLGRVLRRVRRRGDLERSLPALRTSVLDVFRGGWRPMTGGMVAYLLLQLALLWLCFRLLGTSLSLPVLITGLAVERLLTLIPITPGGAGVVEVGTVAALVAMGVDPAAVTAGIVLFRGFTYLLEIPVGGVTLACWLLVNRKPAVAA